MMESTLAGKVPRNEGDYASRASSEGRATKQGSSSTTAARVTCGFKPRGRHPEPVQVQSVLKISDLGEMTARRQGCSEITRRENATQGVGNPTGLAQAAPKRKGERVPKPFWVCLWGLRSTADLLILQFRITTTKTAISKRKSLQDEKASSSWDPLRAPTKPRHRPLSRLDFDWDSAVTPSLLFGTPLPRLVLQAQSVL
ncbi:hypothetical protein EDB86DRAFT_2824518 [Lactarius hatsudake]|nr:hypothetical protein EDB86DRAFT_2824518 [Lactarius hatsudake]